MQKKPERILKSLKNDLCTCVHGLIYYEISYMTSQIRTYLLLYEICIATSWTCLCDTEPSTIKSRLFRKHRLIWLIMNVSYLLLLEAWALMSMFPLIRGQTGSRQEEGGWARLTAPPSLWHSMTTTPTQPITCWVGGYIVQILRGARRAETPRMNIPVSTGFNRSVVGSMSLEEEHTCTH